MTKEAIKRLKKEVYNLVFEAQRDGIKSNISFDEVNRRIDKILGDL